MTWSGEDPASGIVVFTEDGSYNSLVGNVGEVIIWQSGGAEFRPQTDLDSGPGASGGTDTPVQVSVSGTPVFEIVEDINFTGEVEVTATASGVDVEIVRLQVPGPSGSIVTADGNGNIFSSDANVDSSGTITLPGGQVVNGVLVSSTSYIMQQTDWLVISTATVARTIYLPANPDTWQYHNIKDGAGNSKARNITINGNGNTIDGNVDAIINGQYTCLSFVYNGTEWNII